MPSRAGEIVNLNPPPFGPVAYVAPFVFNMIRGEAVAINDLSGSTVNPFRLRAADFAKPVGSVVDPPPVYNRQ